MEYKFYIQPRYQIRHLIDLTGALIIYQFLRWLVKIALFNLLPLLLYPILHVIMFITNRKYSFFCIY